jgi:hypothetical protein
MSEELISGMTLCRRLGDFADYVIRVASCHNCIVIPPSLVSHCKEKLHINWFFLATLCVCVIKSGVLCLLSVPLKL